MREGKGAFQRGLTRFGRLSVPGIRGVLVQTSATLAFEKSGAEEILDILRRATPGRAGEVSSAQTRFMPAF